MLGKLLKYEFRATARVFLPIYLAMIILAGLMCLVLALPHDNMGLTFFRTIISIVYVMGAIGLAVTTVVVLVSRFYKNLLGQEGYLMFTLPVTAGQNILAKLLPALCWSIGSIFLCLLVIFLQTWINGSSLFGSFDGSALGFALFALLSLAAFILFCYLCMGIGQLFNDHKFLASIGAFILIQLILQIVGVSAGFALARWSVFLDAVSGISGIEDLSSGLILTCLNGAALVSCLILFFVTRWLLDKKLNLA